MRIWYSAKLQRFQGQVTITIFFSKIIISLCDAALYDVMKKLGKAACFVSLYLRVCVCVCVFCQTHTHPFPRTYNATKEPRYFNATEQAYPITRPPNPDSLISTSLPIRQAFNHSYV
jgi:hypothetical protein